MKRFLPAVVAVLTACTTPAPPAPVTTPAPPGPPTVSFSDVNAQYLSRIEENRRSVDSYESRKEEIVDGVLEDLERLRGIQAVRRSEIETKRKKTTLLKQQHRDLKQRLAKENEGTASSEITSRRESEITRVASEIRQEEKALEGLLAEAEQTDQEIQRLEQADREGLFLDEVQPVYRVGIELHLGYYRDVIEIARQQLTPGEDSSAFIGHMNERIVERDRLLRDTIEPAAFATLTREFELDRRMSQAWLSALILEVTFSLGEFRLETISDDERDELELLAESLEESWNSNARLVMFIDGHADSKRFRGRTECVSATKNRDLSERRAEVVREFFRQRLGGDDGRIRIDYFGNFSLLRGGEELADADERENRRIELRITSERRDGGFGSHRDFFAMRRGLEIAGRTFTRRPGVWVDVACADRVPEAEVEYLSAEYDELIGRLGLAGTSTTLTLGMGARQLEVRPGNAFTVADGERCVAVVPCPDPEPGS